VWYGESIIGPNQPNLNNILAPRNANLRVDVQTSPLIKREEMEIRFLLLYRSLEGKMNRNESY